MRDSNVTVNDSILVTETTAGTAPKRVRQSSGMSMAQPKPEGSTLEKYRAAKETIRELERAARQELIEKYHSLTAEAAAIQKELKEVFDYKVKPLAPKSRKPRSTRVTAPVEPKADHSKQIARLKKRIETARQNVGRAGDPKASRVFQDRVAELEDELRLLTTDD